MTTNAANVIAQQLRPLVQAQAAVMPMQAQGPVTSNQTHIPTPAPRPGATMSKSIDNNVEYFHYKTDLTVDQPVDLPDGNYFKARRTKDEDVTLNAQGQMVIVATDVTTITQTIPHSDGSYDYADMKKEVAKYAKKCHDLGVKLNGEVVVFDSGNQKYFRLLVLDNNVTVEGAILAWPGGGTAPLHADW